MTITTTTTSNSRDLLTTNLVRVKATPDLRQLRIPTSRCTLRAATISRGSTVIKVATSSTMSSHTTSALTTSLTLTLKPIRSREEDSDLPLKISNNARVSKTTTIKDHPRPSLNLRGLSKPKLLLKILRDLATTHRRNLPSRASHNSRPPIRRILWRLTTRSL